MTSGTMDTERTEEGGSMAGAGLGGVAPRVRPEGALINAENGGNMRRKKSLRLFKKTQAKTWLLRNNKIIASREF